MTAATASAEFTRRADPYRAELLAHCYRMLGSVHDAEDLVQETYLRAWRSYDSFEGRASMRTWLYKIATNACLNALAHSERRVLPAGLGASTDDPNAPLVKPPEISWLQPLPDQRLGDDPAVVATTREGIRLAFVAALQYLPAKQRAALILRDVLAWPAAEVAALLGATPAAVNSALQRARAQLAAHTPDSEKLTPPNEPEARELVERYAAALLRADPAALAALLRADVELEMPPHATWFAGRATVAAFLADRIEQAGLVRTVPTTANGQPALLLEHHDHLAAPYPHAAQVFTFRDGLIARIVVFLDPAAVALFGFGSGVAAPR